MRKKKVLFLDRDGVIVIEDQIDSYERIIYIPHVFEALRKIRRECDYSFVMVSNQDGVGTPSFLYEDFIKCQRRIIETLENEDIYFDDINVDYSLPSDNCPTRKPSAKMLESYKSGEYDLENSFMIGDRLTDMMLAKNIGCDEVRLGTFVKSVYKMLNGLGRARHADHTTENEIRETDSRLSPQCGDPPERSGRQAADFRFGRIPDAAREDRAESAAAQCDMRTPAA